MSSFGSAVDTALAGRVVTIAGALEIVLPSATIRLIDGAGKITFPDARVFTGRDSVFGTIGGVDAISDGAGDQAPALRLTLFPASDAAAADLAGADMQGSEVTFYLVIINPDTGAVIGTPEEIFSGLLDVPTLRSGPNSRSLEYEITSVLEDMFMNDDGARLNNAFHQSFWPGELGFEFVTAIPHQIYWHTNPDHNGVDKHALSNILGKGFK